MFYRATAVTGLTFVLVDRTTGQAVTSGDVSGFVTKDGGAPAALTTAPAFNAGSQVVVDLSAAETDADTVGILLTHEQAVPVNFTIKTVPRPPHMAAVELLLLQPNQPVLVYLGRAGLDTEQSEVKIYKPGFAGFGNADSNKLDAEAGSGWYTYTPSPLDLDTLGTNVFRISHPDAADTFVTARVSRAAPPPPAPFPRPSI